MSKTGDAIAQKLKSLKSTAFIVGTFVSTNSNGTVQVDFGNGPISCQSASPTQPLPGDSVVCIQNGASTVMLGPSSPRSPYGTVTATGSPTITVTTSSGSQQLFYVTTYTPTIGDTVVISGGIVVGKASGTPAGNYAPPPAAPKKYLVEFVARDSGTYYVPGSVYNNTDVWCTSTGNNIGAWFYGTSIADTIPNGAVINSVQLYVEEFYNEFPFSRALIGLHALTSKSGAPSISSAVAIPGGAGWITLPTSFGDALKTGTRKGVGTGSSGGSGFHKYRGRSADADSGKLRIGWTV
jgi:hypothetical protein